MDFYARQLGRLFGLMAGFLFEGSVWWPDGSCGRKMVPTSVGSSVLYMFYGVCDRLLPYLNFSNLSLNIAGIYQN